MVAINQRALAEAMARAQIRTARDRGQYTDPLNNSIIQEILRRIQNISRTYGIDSNVNSNFRYPMNASQSVPNSIPNSAPVSGQIPPDYGGGWQGNPNWQDPGMNSNPGASSPDFGRQQTNPNGGLHWTQDQQGRWHYTEAWY